MTCNREEMKILQRAYEDSEEEFWVYRVPAWNRCSRCDVNGSAKYWFYQCGAWCSSPFESVDVPISVKTVGTVERAIHASSVAEKGSAFRAHGTFIHHLSLLDCPETLKQSLCAWAPAAMMGFMEGKPGVMRKLRIGRPSLQPESPTEKPIVGNPDIQDGRMIGTQLKGDEFGKEDRVSGEVVGATPEKVLATQIGPDLIPTEVIQSTKENLECGLSKRVRPLPFDADKATIRRIDDVVTALIKKVFSRKKIVDWREHHPCFDEFKSRKWSGDRWRDAVHEAISDSHCKIEQEFQIKVNEALPAKGKAPRPIIQSGDKGQIMMALPIKCLEELMFDYFEPASIKHCSKADAMKRAAERLRQETHCNVIEGDGSAWDSCCNPRIRGMIENRIIEHIIQVLGEDPEVPKSWLNECLRDMKKKKIKGKAKVDNKGILSPIRVFIDAIRQSGHRGTSCLNWLINFVCWICAVAAKPADLIGKNRAGKLHDRYVSLADGKEYVIKYMFEGDDSAISTTETLNPDLIEKYWTSLGFRMKLVFVKEKLTFTGFDFLCDKWGPTGVFVPEIPRNIASSCWSCSSELKSHPERVHKVGAAAMLARAENFRMCGPFCRYFAQLGLAHAKNIKDFGLEEAEALSLGLDVSPSVVDWLQRLSDDATTMDASMRKLVKLAACDLSVEQEVNLLTCEFDDPCDVSTARELIPLKLWNPERYETARR